MNAELDELAKTNEFPHRPITDGVINADRYLASAPKILWILKEPWEKPAEGAARGGWSISEYLAGEPKFGNKGTWARMAYVCYAIFNGFLDCSVIPYATADSRVLDAFKNIACINVKKFSGKTLSNPAEIAKYYHKYRDLLNRQIDAIHPDVIIAGNILSLFYEDFGLKPQDMTRAGSVQYCRRDQRLYINAYHPSNWRIKKSTYVNDLVAVIKSHRPMPQVVT